MIDQLQEPKVSEFGKVIVDINRRFLDEVAARDASFQKRIAKCGDSAIQASIFYIESFEAPKFQHMPMQASLFPEIQSIPIARKLERLAVESGSYALLNVTRGWSFHEGREYRATLALEDDTRVSAHDYLRDTFAPEYADAMARLYVAGLRGEEVAS